MLFNSYEFIFLFMPVVITVYILLSRLDNRDYSLAWLVVASLTFYAWWNPAYLSLLILSMGVNFLAARLLCNNKNKLVLLAGIVFNLGLLGYFKYANFFVENMNNLVGTSWNLEKIILPLAISFFTFQQIAYLVDVFRKETGKDSFIHYALFVTFFPQLIAGPIVHHKEMMPQFYEKKQKIFDSELFAAGITIFAMGLFKKVVIADSLSVYANEAFSSVANGNMLSFFEAWKGTLSYSFQLYFDFSGYSDMAIGIAALFGIKLPMNFNSPYQANNITDFWRRWHMTLSRFLRDYLYIPLGGNRKGKVRRYINLVITMLLGGLWHGANWTFVIWGGLHGIYLVINHSWQTVKCRIGFSQNQGGFRTKFLSRGLTFLVVVLAWVVFRSENMDSAFLMYKSLFGQGEVIWPADARNQLGFMADHLESWGVIFAYPQQFNGMSHLAGLLIASLFVMYAPGVHKIMGNHPVALYSPQPGRLTWQPTTRWAIFSIILLMSAILKLGQVSEFLYFQF